MNKPKLFISHSSRDKYYLVALKNMIANKTKGTLEIFLSSDGQSIPFGNNWIHAIEAALDETSVMLVAVSPQSLKSGWLYFEAGYSYCRDVKVIPIGIKGLAIQELGPPLSLLQGFNLASHEGLNNIIAVINREYGYDFDEDFGTNDFQKLANLEEDRPASSPLYREIMDYISVHFPSSIKTEDETVELKKDYTQTILQTLDEMQIDYHPVGSTTIMLRGAQINLKDSEHESSHRDQPVSLQIDILAFGDVIPLIRSLFLRLYSERRDKWWFRVFFQPDVSVLTADFKVSSRLAQIGVDISNVHGRLYQFENLLFAMDEPPTISLGSQRSDQTRPTLRVVVDQAYQGEVPLFDLVQLLLDAGVVSKHYA